VTNRAEVSCFAPRAPSASAAAESSSPMSDAHQTVLLDEAVDALAIRPDGCYIDATFGRGGHSRKILSQLGPTGRLLSLDRDPQAIASGALLDDPRFTLVHGAFDGMADAAKQVGFDMARVDGVLFDLGLSSPQLDTASRGFSFRFDAPLDMRMDTTRGQTAAAWLAEVDEKTLAEVIKNYGEERFAVSIAKKVVAARTECPITTTGQFAALVRACVRTREPGQDAATRTFQAVRIYINQEISQLALTLPQALELLKPGGRLVVISFHSLEDRVVKRFMQAGAKPAEPPKGVPLTVAQLPKPVLAVVGKPVKASAAELALNPRARSAIMRVAEKLAA
jgi:16S rRNA (cytosine1402-N4)-methyltransferase